MDGIGEDGGGISTPFVPIGEEGECFCEEGDQTCVGAGGTGEPQNSICTLSAPTLIGPRSRL